MVDGHRRCVVRPRGIRTHPTGHFRGICGCCSETCDQPPSYFMVQMSILVQLKRGIMIRTRNRAADLSTKRVCERNASFRLCPLSSDLICPPPLVSNQAQQGRSNFLCPVFRGDNVIEAAATSVVDVGDPPEDSWLLLLLLPLPGPPSSTRAP